MRSTPTPSLPAKCLRFAAQDMAGPPHRADAHLPCYDGQTIRITPTGKRAKAPFQMTPELRAEIAPLGELTMLDPYHWQVRRDGGVIADWWPHKNKFRVRQEVMAGDGAALVAALQSLTPR